MLIAQFWAILQGVIPGTGCVKDIQSTLTFRQGSRSPRVKMFSCELPDDGVRKRKVLSHTNSKDCSGNKSKTEQPHQTPAIYACHQHGSPGLDRRSYLPCVVKRISFKCSSSHQEIRYNLSRYRLKIQDCFSSINFMINVCTYTKDSWKQKLKGFRSITVSDKKEQRGRGRKRSGNKARRRVMSPSASSYEILFSKI